MSDSLDRLYQAVIAAKDLDPAVSRTARLFQRGPAQMAKKLAEEAIEVVIDAVNGKPDAVVRESADLLYNLTVLWASAGVQPEDVWREMERRDREWEELERKELERRDREQQLLPQQRLQHQQQQQQPQLQGTPQPPRHQPQQPPAGPLPPGPQHMSGTGSVRRPSQ